MDTVKKAKLLQRRRWRIRKKVNGTAERPRLSVRFTNKHIYAQCIDDDAGRTLVFLSSLDKDLRSQKVAANLKGAEILGKAFGEKAKAAGIDKVVFDRNGRRYHGCVKVFADSVRECGLNF
ncbi:MAG: 50S ribosomal protein L18 [Verrucomicrobia bacterium]|nr:MAG: 50S ribosomal protein L18 [Verrucomicrobiota bacterium]